jgi:integrase/recombinase XerD
MQFRVAVDEFIRFCAVERQLSSHTLQAYTCDLADFRKGLSIDAPLADVSTSTLKDYLEDMVGRRRLAAATIRRRFACLRAFFRRQAQLERAADPFTTWRLQLPRRTAIAPYDVARRDLGAAEPVTLTRCTEQAGLAICAGRRAAPDDLDWPAGGRAVPDSDRGRVA